MEPHVDGGEDRVHQSGRNGNDRGLIGTPAQRISGGRSSSAVSSGEMWVKAPVATRSARPTASPARALPTIPAISNQRSSPAIRASDARIAGDVLKSAATGLAASVRGPTS